MKYEKILVVIFAVIFAFFAIVCPSKFLNPFNLQTMLFQLPEFTILTFGMMVCILTGGINLSISAVTALSGIIAAIVLTSFSESILNPNLLIFLAVVFGLVLAVMTGLLNGFFVAILGVTPILVTIGSQAVLEGIGYILTKGGSVSGFPFEFFFVGGATVFGVPVPLYILIVISGLMYFLLHRTPWGSNVFFIGSNIKAAEYSGIPVKRVLMQVYILSSCLAGVAAIIMISRYNSGKVTLGSSYLLQTVAAAVLGGTSISGGKGNVIGVILATAILQIVSTGMNLLGINRFIITVTMGLILILTLTVNFIFTTEKIKSIRFFKEKVS